MAWTSGQRAVRDLAVSRPARGFELNLVLAENRSGVSELVTALTHAQRPSVRCYNVHAAGGWEAVGSLSLLAGTRMRTGFSDSLALALKTLGGEEHTPICLLLDSAEMLRGREMLRLGLALEWAATWADVPTRAMFLWRPVEIWRNKEQEYRAGFPRIPAFFQGRFEAFKRSVLHLTRVELEKLSTRDMPKGLFEEAA